MKAPRPKDDTSVAAARAAILLALRRFDYHHETGGRRAVAAFAAAYNAGGLDVPPWAREQAPRVAVGTLYRWAKRFAAGGTAALEDSRRGNGRKSPIDDDAELAEFIAGVIYHREHLSATMVREFVAARFPSERVPSERALQRWIAAWRKANASDLLHVSNPDAWKSKYRAAAGSADGNVADLNALWEADSTLGDVFCLVDGAERRHAFVGIIDVYSRRARVLVSPTSKSDAIAACLGAAIRDWGVPEAFKSDNGKDYTSQHLIQVYADLGIRHETCLPFTPEAKPHIERFFGTLARDLLEGLPGYAGHSVADAQALRSRKAFAQRFGDGRAIKIALTPEQLQERIDSWLANVYERRPHSGLGGVSPFVRAASWEGRPRTIDDEDALDMLLAAPVGWRKVGKKGLAVEGGAYDAPELGAIIGQRVQVRRVPGDMGRLRVLDADGAPICIAVDPARVGIDRRELAARKLALQKAAWREASRDIKRTIAAARPETLMDERLAAAAAESDRVVQLPRPGVSHETPALDAAAAAVPGLSKRRGPAPLTDDQIAAAAEYREEAEARAAPPAPALREDGAPLDDDVAFYLWVEANPDLADDADRALCARLMEESATFRRLVDRARAQALAGPGINQKTA